MNACRMNFRLIGGISIYLAFLAQFTLSPSLSASESPFTWNTVGGAAGNRSSASSVKFSGTGAVDASGVRHSGSDYGRKPPFLLDITNAVTPYGPHRSDRFPGPQRTRIIPASAGSENRFCDERNSCQINRIRTARHISG
jgi:hypothetical protein